MSHRFFDEIFYIPWISHKKCGRKEKTPQSCINNMSGIVIYVSGITDLSNCYVSVVCIVAPALFLYPTSFFNKKTNNES